MAEKEYIEREAVLQFVFDACAECMDACEEFDGIYADCNQCMLEGIKLKLRDLPAADVRPVVLCRDCIYWQKPQVWQNDGTFRDYEPGEYERGSIFGGVSIEVGVNYGSFCALYNRNHENRIPQFMDENDFCSKGYKREES